MVSSYKVVNQSLGYGALATPPCFAKLTYSYASLALSQRCRSRSARAVRPASLAASARCLACRRSLVEVGTLWPAPERATRARSLASAMQVWLLKLCLAAFHPVPSLAAFEATMRRHASALLLHQSPVLVLSAGPSCSGAVLAACAGSLAFQARVSPLPAAA